jgi:hypothetical protein
MRKDFARVSRSLLFTAICVLLFRSPSNSQDEPFYQGKTLRVIAGTTAGALYDQWARVIAAHIVKHIPGNPQAIACRARATRSRPTIFIMWPNRRSHGNWIDHPHSVLGSAHRARGG